MTFEPPRRQLTSLLILGALLLAALLVAAIAAIEDVVRDFLYWRKVR